MLDHSKIWLEDITGPLSLHSAICTTLANGMNVHFSSDPSMPWREHFQGAIESRLAQRDLMFRMVDCADCDTNDIGRYLLQDINHTQVSEYLHQRDPITFIRKNKLFKNWVFWLRGMNPQQIAQWIRFIASCRGSSGSDGLFILEVPANYESYLSSVRTAKTIKYFDNVKQQDLQLFTTILAEHSEIPQHLRQYASWVAACLFVTDAQAAAKMIECIDFEETDPIDAVEKIYDEYFYDSDRDFDASPQPHPFTLVKTDKEQLKRRVWVAQLQTAFPAIELERIAFVTQRQDDIMTALQSQFMDYGTSTPTFVLQFEKKVEHPYEAELTTLVKLSKLCKIGLQGSYLLELKEDDKQRLEFLRDKRNDLAHMKICSPQEMSALFNPRFV
ncbi:MAG: hypothetical protein LBC41_03235 [Clostridiales bacterium]|nr:hypothetical protein [Clostridiales bacterium]MDR2749653.1 hypothetical protein [Clostridiales bacterium]